MEASTGEEDELAEMAPQADAILTCWKAVSTRTIRGGQALPDHRSIRDRPWTTSTSRSPPNRASS